MKWHVCLILVSLGFVIIENSNGISAMEPVSTKRQDHNDIFDTSVAVYEHHKKKLYQNKDLKRRNRNFNGKARRKLLKMLEEVYDFDSDKADAINGEPREDDDNTTDPDSAGGRQARFDTGSPRNVISEDGSGSTDTEDSHREGQPCNLMPWRHHRRNYDKPLRHPCHDHWSPHPPPFFPSRHPPPFGPHHHRPPPRNGMDWKILAAILGIAGMLITIVVSTIKHIYSRRSNQSASSASPQDPGDGATRRVLPYRMGRAGYAHQSALPVPNRTVPDRYPLPPSAEMAPVDIFSPPPYDVAITLPPSYDQVDVTISEGLPPPPPYEIDISQYPAIHEMTRA